MRARFHSSVETFAYLSLTFIIDWRVVLGLPLLCTLRECFVREREHTWQSIHASAASSLTQWSTNLPEGLAETVQEKTRPFSSPTYTVLWSRDTARLVTAAGLKVEKSKNQSGETAISGGKFLKCCSVLDKSHLGAKRDFEIWTFEVFFLWTPKAPLRMTSRGSDLNIKMGQNTQEIHHKAWARL